MHDRHLFFRRNRARDEKVLHDVRRAVRWLLQSGVDSLDRFGCKGPDNAMLLLILWGLVTTLAVGQGLLVLFLIRTRGHALTQSAEILRLQDVARTVATTRTDVAALVVRLQRVEEELFADDEVEQEPAGRIIRLAAVGGRTR